MKSANIYLFLIAFLAMTAQSYAKSPASQWFLHEFGEIRAYHGDFLNVCAGEGYTLCRTVQYGFKGDEEDKFFGATRLSIARTPNLASTTNERGNADQPGHTIEIFIRELPDKPQGPITLAIDGDIFQLTSDDWQAGSPEGYNVSETFSITDPVLIGTLIKKMRAGDRLRVLYDGYNETFFQLRGLTKALDAIEAHLQSANN